MFDDIALNPKNPKRGVIINRPGERMFIKEFLRFL